MKGLSNEEKFENYKKRKVLRILIILLLLATIVFSILNLVIKTSILYPIVTFVVAHFLTRYRNSLDFKDK